MIHIINSPVDKKWINNLLKLILKKEKKYGVELNVVFTNDRFIRQLNRKYRKVNKSTDVLSFFYSKEKYNNNKILVSGDIVISIETAKKQAKRYKHSLRKEIAILLIHGLYHLFGYDHKTKKEFLRMHRKEIRYNV